MRKGIHLTIGILSGILFTQNIWAQTLKEPVIESQAAVVMDMDSGDILYEKNGKEKLYSVVSADCSDCRIRSIRGRYNICPDYGADRHYIQFPGIDEYRARIFMRIRVCSM